MIAAEISSNVGCVDSDSFVMTRADSSLSIPRLNEGRVLNVC